MKILSKLLLLATLFLVLCTGFIYVANQGKLNGAIRHGLQYALGVNGIPAQIINCQFHNGFLTSSEVKIKLGSSLAVITDLKIQINILSGFINPNLLIEILPMTMIVWDARDEQILQMELAGTISGNLFAMNRAYNLNVDNIQIANISDINNKALEIGGAKCKYNILENQQEFNCAVNFGEDTKFKIKNLEEEIGKIKIEMSNIPIMLYKQVIALFPENKLLIFLEEFIRNGHIENGNITWVSDSELTKETLVGALNIRNLDFDYAEELPTLKDISLDIEIQGSNMIASINSAYSSDVLLSGGALTMDWKGVDETLLILKTTGHGSAKSLTDFILEKQHQAMVKANIDLSKITGEVDIDADIIIPLKPGTPNIYNITAQLPNTSLNIFQDNVLLQAANISGKFDGDQVTFNGDGKINGFDSNLNFIYNIENESEFSHKLDITAHLKREHEQEDRDTKIGFATILGGSATMDIKYIHKNAQGLVLVDSDISKLDLYFDKLGIKKKENAEAKLVVNGAFIDPTNGAFDFAITGEEGLNINGDIIIKDDFLEANIKEIQAKKTDLSAKFSMEKGHVIADFQGKLLDLSNSDMLQFLEKERNGGSTKLSLDVDKVRLKDDIWLDDLKLMFECDQDRCFAGQIDSKLGSRSIEMALSAEGENEKWLIKCSNAGALLRGVGAYDTMKAGDLTLNINTSRREVKPGQIIPIIDGTFLFKRFVLSDTPIMTQVVSVASLPGLLNVILGKTDIIFSRMDGKFSFANNSLTIIEGAAKGPYFDFNVKGNIDIKNKLIDIQGRVIPNLYGISSVLGAIPIIGTIFSGTKKQSGLISGGYRIKEKY